MPFNLIISDAIEMPNHIYKEDIWGINEHLRCFAS